MNARPLPRSRFVVLLLILTAATALVVYKLDQDSYPRDLKALSAGTEAYPGGFLAGDSLPVDGWGRDYRYLLTSAGYHLWSVGPDGVDQKGMGDDLQAD